MEYAWQTLVQTQYNIWLDYISVFCEVWTQRAFNWQPQKLHHEAYLYEVNSLQCQAIAKWLNTRSLDETKANPYGI